MANSQDNIKYLTDNNIINVNGEWAQFQGLKNKTRWKEELSKTALKQINSVYKKATKVPTTKPEPKPTKKQNQNHPPNQTHGDIQKMNPLQTVMLLICDL